MKDQAKSSHECDALGGISKSSQKRIAPDDVVLRTDADVVKHVRELERRNAATSASVAGIPELTPHSNKRDLPSSAPGKSTRVSKESDGVISQPNSDARPRPGKDSTNSCDSLSESQIKRLSRQAPGDAKERPVEKLRESRRRQLGSNGMQGN